MIYQRLGNTPFTVSRICFGVLTVGPLCADLPVSEGAAVIRAALEHGINFFDTAQYYETYPHLRAGLKGWNKDVVIVSKSYAETVEDLQWAVEEARRELDRDFIDVFMLHEQRSAQIVRDHLPLLEYLHTAKAQGLIGAVGISAHDVSAVQAAAEMPEIEVIHPMLNKAGVGIRGGSLKEMIAAVQAAHDNGKGLYGMKAIGGGSLMKDARAMLEWAFSRDYLDAVAIGMKDIAEVAVNCGWLAGYDVPEQSQLKLLERNLVVEKYDACRGCGRCVKACPQGALSIVNFQAQWDKSKCVYCGYCIPACEYFCLSFA